MALIVHTQCLCHHKTDIEYTGIDQKKTKPRTNGATSIATITITKQFIVYKPNNHLKKSIQMNKCEPRKCGTKIRLEINKCQRQMNIHKSNLLAK